MLVKPCLGLRHRPWRCRGGAGYERWGGAGDHRLLGAEHLRVPGNTLLGLLGLGGSGGQSSHLGLGLLRGG